MATAPFSLFVDIPSVVSAVRVSSTVTVTTSAAHGLTTGTYVQLEGFTGTAGTSMNGVFSATVTSGTTFTVTDSGSAGTATAGSAVVSRDLFSPLIDLAANDRQTAVYAIPEGLTMSASGDGNSNTFGFQVAQDDTPSDGPWWANIPDQSRVRLYKVATGTTPTDADLYFIGTISDLAATLNGSGQGSLVDVTVDDVNSILDKLVVVGKSIRQAELKSSGGFERVSNITTVTTETVHNYTTATTVTIKGVIGGGANFNGSFPVLTPVGTTFTYSNSGAAGTGNIAMTPGSAFLVPKSLQQVQLNFTTSHFLSVGDSVRLTNFVCSSQKFTNQLSGTLKITKVPAGSAMIVTMDSPLDNPQTVTVKGTVKGVPTVVPSGSSAAERDFGIDAGWSEDTAATKALGVVNDRKSKDPYVQRLFNTGDTSQVTGSSNSSNQIGAAVPPGTFREVLDGVVEAFGGQDSKARRYWIGFDRKLYYKLVSATEKPTYANAPYKIITTGTQNPDTTVAAATVFPFSISVGLDHNTVKNALVQVSSSTGTPASAIAEYTNSGYSLRAGSPNFDSVLRAPTIAANATASIARAARSYFLEAHAPIQTVSFTLRGAGDAAHNVDGFSAGYYQTGAATFALQKRWEPGQWVSITCAELGLSGLYRVESVDWSLMPGTFLQEIVITANRRRPNSLTDIVKRGR